jgi:pentapeptide MXKDX repeat protein
MEPDAMQPDAMEPDAMEPMEPDAMQPMEPDAMQPDAMEPDAMEPMEPDAMQPDAMEPDAMEEVRRAARRLSDQPGQPGWWCRWPPAGGVRSALAGSDRTRSTARRCAISGTLRSSGSGESPGGAGFTDGRVGRTVCA